MIADLPCPECIAGKHANCDGTALDSREDVVGACPCARAGHAEMDHHAGADIARYLPQAADVHSDDVMLSAELVEEGRRLASERDNLVAYGVDPADLEIPRAPEPPGGRGVAALRSLRDAEILATMEAEDVDHPVTLNPEAVGNPDLTPVVQLPEGIARLIGTIRGVPVVEEPPRTPRVPEVDATCPLTECGSPLYLELHRAVAITDDPRVNAYLASGSADSWEVTCENGHRIANGSPDFDSLTARHGYRLGQILGGVR